MPRTNAGLPLASSSIACLAVPITGDEALAGLLSQANAKLEKARQAASGANDAFRREQILGPIVVALARAGRMSQAMEAARSLSLDGAHARPLRRSPSTRNTRSASPLRSGRGG